MFKEMLKKRMRTLKEGKKKGFTLIEVIVVLVILAILAAIAIPALTGYIDKANSRAAQSEARNVQVALQEIASDAYGSDQVMGDNAGSGFKDADMIPGSKVKFATEINNLMGVSKLTDDDDTTLPEVNRIKYDGNALTDFVYTTAKYVVTYNNVKGYSVVPNA
jgi:type IV pilus assembly protein PilA